MSDEKKVFVRTVIARADVPTVNGRIYPKAVLEEMVNEAKEKVNNRTLLLYEFDQSDPYRLDVGAAAGVVTDLEVEASGEVRSTIEFLNKPIAEVVETMGEEKFSFTVTGRSDSVSGSVVNQFTLLGVNISLKND